MQIISDACSRPLDGATLCPSALLAASGPAAYCTRLLRLLLLRLRLLPTVMLLPLGHQRELDWRKNVCQLTN